MGISQAEHCTTGDQLIENTRDIQTLKETVNVYWELVG